MVPEFFKTVVTTVAEIPPFVELALVYMDSLDLIINLNSIFLYSISPSPGDFTLLKMKSKKPGIKLYYYHYAIIYEEKINDK